MRLVVIPPQGGRWRAGRFWPWEPRPEPVEIDEATAEALMADHMFRVELVDERKASGEPAESKPSKRSK